MTDIGGRRHVSQVPLLPKGRRVAGGSRFPSLWPGGPPSETLVEFTSVYPRLRSNYTTMHKNSKSQHALSAEGVAR
ncbi:hypothetical protein SRHO_G00088280 [Serrasalmus rhombeus]